MINAYWCKRVLVAAKRERNTSTVSENTKYETNENYVICMGICKDFLKIANLGKIQPDEDICGDDIYLDDFVLDTAVDDVDGI